MTLKKNIRIYYHHLMTPGEISRLKKGDLETDLETEVVTITDAYFGRHPIPDSGSIRAELGLNLFLAFPVGQAGATYTKMADIEGLMDKLGAMRTEDLVGKNVLACLVRGRVIGLSVY